MRYVYLVLFILILLQLASADYTVGKGGAEWSGNATFDNVTEDFGSSYIKVGLNQSVFADDFDDGNEDWTLGSGNPMVVTNEHYYSAPYSFRNNATVGVTSSEKMTFPNTNAVVSIMFRDNTSYDDEGIMGVGDGVTACMIGHYSAESSVNYTYRIGASWYTTTIARTTGWLEVRFDYASGSYVLGYIDNIEIFNSSSLTYFNVITVGDLWSVGSNEYFYYDDVRIYNTTTGNLSTWYDAGSGYETYELWFNFTSTQNHSDYYRDNNTGSYVLLGANQVGNKSYPLSTKYQDTQPRTILHGNTTDTPELISITFKTQPSVGSVDIIYYNLDYDNPINVYINISNKTEPLNTINLTHIGNLSSVYCLNHPNGTAVQACVTCTGEGDTIWFNGSADRLPEATNYSINESADTSTIVIPANAWGMVNNWTVATSFSNIAANESNDVCYSYYNVTDGEWHSHYVGYSWNSNYVIPLEASVMMYTDIGTTVTATIVTPSSTELYVGWNQLFIEGTDNKTISDIISDIGANCTDVWKFNSTAGAYSNTSSDTIQPCQGFLGYITQDMTWTRSDL